jgi:hypothetical protein
MTKCLNDRSLFLINEGSGDSEHQSHLKSCRSCRRRYERLTADLELLGNTLSAVASSPRPSPLRMPIIYRSLPIAVALLLGIVLIWGESRFWSPISSSSELSSSPDLTQFLDQVAAALFSNPNDKDADAVSPDPDMASVQAALGQDCSNECRELFASLMQDRSR